MRDHFGDNPYILVTYDNAMSVEHASTLIECGTTLAVIDSRERGTRGLELTEDEYTSEVIHRHAHTFYDQERGTVFKYRCSTRRTKMELGTNG